MAYLPSFTSWCHHFGTTTQPRHCTGQQNLRMEQRQSWSPLPRRSPEPSSPEPSSLEPGIVGQRKSLGGAAAYLNDLRFFAISREDPPPPPPL